MKCLKFFLSLGVSCLGELNLLRNHGEGECILLLMSARNYEWKQKGTWILKRVLEHFMQCFPENHLANRFKCESQNVVFYIVMPTSGSSVLSGILWSWKCSSRICPVNQTCCNSICKFLQIFTIKSKCQKASVFVFTVYVCWSF